MRDLLRSVRDLKTRAKNRRDLGLRGYPRAVTILDQAIAKLREQIGTTSTGGSRSQLASELADCYGIQGGIQRRWGLELAGGAQDEDHRLEHLAASVEAYDKGYAFESAKEFGIVNSYNLVNRLISRILYDPRVLFDPAVATSPPNVEVLDVSAKLQEAEEIVRKQLRLERRGDVWALSDLALLRLLLDRDDADSSYGDFTAASPPDFAYGSAIDTLEELSQLDLPVAEKLKETTRHLKTRLDRMRR